jgi:leader peptidase (prepilin peptidase)/N-methyltransferase
MFMFPFFAHYFPTAHNLSLTAIAALAGLIVGPWLYLLGTKLPVLMQRDWENYLDLECGKEPRHSDGLRILEHPAGQPGLLSYLFRTVAPFSTAGRIVGKTQGPARSQAVTKTLVEVLTATLFAAQTWVGGISAATAFGLVLFSILIALAMIDASSQLLPDSLTMPLLWIGLISNIGGTFVSLTDAVVGAVAGYLLLWSLYWLFKIVTGREGMGHGDFKLLAALGAWFGVQSLSDVLIISASAGVAFGAYMRLRAGKSEHFAFGPFLATAGILKFFDILPVTKMLAAFFYGVPY